MKILRDLHSLLNEELIHIATLARYSHNTKTKEAFIDDLINPFVQTHNSDGVKVAWIKENYGGTVLSWEQAEELFKTKQINIIEIDESYTVRLTDNTLCDMCEIVEYLIKQKIIELEL